MTIRREGPVVVAVDGSEDGRRAVRYGALQAQLSGRPLRLVHVLHDTVPWTPAIPAFTHETLHAAGAQYLRDAVWLADELTDGVLEVDVALVQGPRIPALLEQAEGASLVVVGTRHSAWKRVLTGSTSVALAARAESPVVCVPEGWAHDVARGHALVGVDGSVESVTVLEEAFGHAEERDAHLTVVHAWRPSLLYDPGTAAMVEIDWRRVAGPEVELMVENARAAHPDVKATLELVYEPPADALSAASVDADLMFLGRHGHGGPLGNSVGGTARALMRTASCPVEIVPVPRGGAGD